MPDINTDGMASHGMSSLAILRSHSADSSVPRPSPVAFGRMHSATHSADGASRKRHPLPNKPRPAPVLVRADNHNGGSSRTALSRAAATILLERQLLSSPEDSAASGSPESSPARSPKPPPPLATWRAEYRAKKMDKISHARAMLKQRLVDYCALEDHAHRDEDVAGA